MSDQKLNADSVESLRGVSNRKLDLNGRIVMDCDDRCSIDPFTKKDWYDVKAPSIFAVRNIGKTLVTRTQGKSKELVGPWQQHNF